MQIKSIELDNLEKLEKREENLKELSEQAGDCCVCITATHDVNLDPC